MTDTPKKTMADGSPVTPDHQELKEDGQQKGYVVLSQEERDKGFIRPVQTNYIHNKCGVETTMGISIAETYARDPKFYNSTFCVGCKEHFPLDQFLWSNTDEQVGS